MSTIELERPASTLQKVVVRPANDADVHCLVAMCEEFHAMSPHHDMGQFDKDAMARVLRFMMENTSALMLTNGHGVIAGMLMPVFFAPSRLMMEESIWWAKRGGRELLKSFVSESRLMGADFVLLSTLENEKSKSVERLVSGQGFRPIERRYLKELL
ncbi:MAG: hypothetical protein GY789_00020 [Hyphomicrobiales bacterium]|nr:hypothetical protein [Hyphomicrobiales bacterium]MCP5072742.1 hypothetical protein [Paracoccaceae bacterium]